MSVPTSSFSSLRADYVEKVSCSSVDPQSEDRGDFRPRKHFGFSREQIPTKRHKPKASIDEHHGRVTQSDEAVSAVTAMLS